MLDNANMGEKEKYQSSNVLDRPSKGTWHGTTLMNIRNNATNWNGQS